MTLSSRPRRLLLYLSAVVIFMMALFYLLLSLAPCMLGRGSCYHGYQSEFSFDAGLQSRADWMDDLPDDVNITSISIPGTHDTMTYEIGTQDLQCQNWNLSSQLDAGVRYFDIRARLKQDELQIYHAWGYTGFSLQDVLLTMFDFLDAHPSEAIIMRLKEEGRPIGANTISFEAAFNYYRETSPETSPGAAEHLHHYNSTAPLPTLGELRSKIYILQNFGARGGPYGMRWEGPQMALEDYWIIPDVYHLSEKWTAIRQALEVAATTELDNKLLYLAHLSASIGVLPIEAAAGPQNRTVTGMNDMTGQWLEDFEEVDEATRVGIIIIDFPGKRLIDAILRWNRPFWKT